MTDLARIDLTRRLAGRVAVITGGASGIGLATAKRLAAEGASVVIGDMDATAGPAAAELVGGRFVQVDVTDEAQVDHLFDEAARVYGSVDIAFNNAGISPPDDDSIETTELPAWQKVQDVNLKSVYLCSRAALRHMVAQGRGSIINTASFVALMGAATPQLAYTASKGAVLSLTRELAVIHARESIRVNAICPGPLRTELLMKVLDTDEKKQRRLVHIPMGRFGEAAEIAKAALFLASDDASFMTGASLVVDGGITAANVTPQ
jgi:NAD(P)-dependent dehydrogenase (short-subunit alcohol dehydrogenase family)